MFLNKAVYTDFFSPLLEIMVLAEKLHYSCTVEKPSFLRTQKWSVGKSSGDLFLDI